MNNSKYKFSKSDLKYLFSTADMLMRDRYWELFVKLGFKQGPNKNFHCINSGGHSAGTDAHASLSIDNGTGQFYCHTCEFKGNFQSYWRDYLKGTGAGGDHYSDFIIEFLGMTEMKTLSFNTSFNDPNFEENKNKLKEAYVKLQSEHQKSAGKPYILGDQYTKLAKETIAIPMKELDGYVEALLKDQERMDYLKKTRNIDDELIKCYRIGIDSRRRYIFPMINAEGDLLNMKVYDPFTEKKQYKWMFVHTGRETIPTPINNFTKDKIMFFAGEPDMYCAIAFGYEGAVTMGAEKNADVNKVFGYEKARQLFTNKEIVIVLDTDETGRTYAQKLAHSLYPYAKQIKIIDLDKSDINPNGLDPTKMKTVTVNGKSKEKRAETDFTDFFTINGFNKEAKKIFGALIIQTKVYTENVNRIEKEVCKVTLQESRLSKYASVKENVEVELVASIGDFNGTAYQYPDRFAVTCPHTGVPDSKLYSSCKKCILPAFPAFRDSKEVEFNLIRGSLPKECLNDPGSISVNAHEILGLIEIGENQRLANLKKLCGMNPNCLYTRFVTVVPKKLVRARLVRDVSEYGEAFLENKTDSSAIEVDAYILGEDDITPNKSYRFRGIQTTSPHDSSAVLFLYEAKQMSTSVQNFKMDQDTHDMLKIFQPRDGESIEAHLDRRYDVLSHAAGVTGRTDMFLINDLAFFSPTEIRNKKLFPSLKRGWVEVLICGDTRCCKTMISKFLMNYYKVGDLITGSTAISRAGLIGGTKFIKGKPTISWGKLVMNDCGTVIIDELSNLDQQTLTDLNGARADGFVEVMTIAGAKTAPVRTRKIMLSNARTWTVDKSASYASGMRFIKNLCFKDEILSRFDAAIVVRQGDVSFDEFAPVYRQPLTEFNEFQSRGLIMWAQSRRPEEIVFEEGIEKHINDCQKKMLKFFHSSTQLVNQEIRLKLARMSTSIASMLYSHLPGDWNKIYVKKEHVEFLVKFLYKIYCHKNMKLDEYSKQQRALEKLGDMRFMENIIKYIDPNSLFIEEEFTDKSLQQIFYDYLERVFNKNLYIVDAKDDNIKTSGNQIHMSIQKLINTLITRHCLIRVKNIYRKTIPFNNWLSDIMEKKDVSTLSNILEPVPDDPAAEVIKKLRKTTEGYTNAQEESAG